MLTAKAVAAQLGLSVRAVYAMVQRGEITYYKFRSAIRFAQADVQKLIPPPKPLPTLRALREYERLRLLAVAAGADDIPDGSENSRKRNRFDPC